MEHVLTAPLPATPVKRTTYRIESIDLLRGLVMIIMALDHTRDFFHKTAMTDDPLNFATTTPQLFFTRWITHFCAPLFVFLAGTSIYLQSLRKTKKQLSRFLLTRGLWLIVMELTLINFAFWFDIHFTAFALQTIWAIGISMVIISALLWLPFRLLAALGFLIVLGHNTLDFYEAHHKGAYSFFYELLHRPGFHPFAGNHFLQILYPFLPWTGLMLLGYCFGALFKRYEGRQRDRVLIWLGVGVIGLFIGLRALNVYGDPAVWTTQKNSLFTFLSFLNTTKYPPSLLYMCMTVGPGILFLGLIGNRVKSAAARIITVYGKVPFFYYILHFYLIHIVSAVFLFTRGHSFAEGAAGVPNFPFRFLIPGEGYSLPVVYLVWLCIVAALYPLCKWYARYKRTHSHWWLSYL